MRSREGRGGRAPRLADLIDLELQLQRDRGRPLEELAQRDGAVAAELAERGLGGRALLLGWLDALRERAVAGLPVAAGGPVAGPFPGRAAEGLRSALGALLSWVGVVSGFAGAGGWLLSGRGEPVNAIRFWLALVGVQLVLLALFALVAALPVAALRVLPGLAGLAGLGSWLPAAAAALLARLPGGPRRLLGELGELQRLDWLYGRLRFWILCGLTQGFAVGFNLGALAACVGIAHIDDPAFGWRSRLIDAGELARVVHAVALPWRQWWPDAVPSLAALEATRYSSLDPRFAEPAPGALAGPAAWAAWWPFLVASLLCYGLAPRLLLWAGARWAAARAIARAPLAHADAARLRERLERPALALGEVGALDAERSAAAPPAASALAAPHSPAAAPALVGRPLQLLVWAGVPLAPEPLRAQAAQSTGAQVAQAVLRVGAVECSGDERALRELRALGPDGAAALCVEAWEPPVADYTDFVRSARTALGARAPLLVWLVQRDAVSESVREAERALWRRQLAALGDPWLFVAGWPGAPAASPLP